MNILRLDLLAFGPFQDVALEFLQPRPGLHVVYGDNEAGKSTCLRAVKQWLYGMPHKSSDDFNIPANRLRIGGVLGNPQGETLEFVRRKGRKDTLRSADDREVLRDDCLRPFLGSVDAAEFSQRFSLDHQELVQGGLSIGTGGEMGEVLFAAGAGIADIRSMQNTLVARCRALFLPTGSLPKINSRLQNLSTIRSRLRETALSSQQWSDVDRQLQAALVQAGEIDAEILQLRQKISLWQRVQKAAPLVAGLRVLQSELLALAEVPRLPADFSAQRLNACNARDIAARAVQEAALRITQLESKIQTVTLPLGLLENQATIQTLHTKLGSIRKAIQDRQRLAAELRTTETSQRQLLSDLHDACATEVQAEWSIGTRLRSQLQDLATEFHTATERNLQAQTALTRLTQEWTQAADSTTTDEDALDLAALKRDLRQAQDWRDVDRQSDQASRLVQDEARELQVKFQGLPMFAGPLETLITLPIPMVETLEQQAAELARCEQLEQRAQETWESIAQRTQNLERDLETLRATQDVPTEQELASIRQQRQTAWEELRQAATEILPDAKDTIQLNPARSELFRLQAETFWDFVLAADGLADRLRREADRVAQYAQIQVDLESSRRAWQRADANRLAAIQQRSDWQAQWQGLWQPLEIVPLSPREMLAWRRQFLELRDQYHAWQKQRARWQELANHSQAARAMIDQVLEQLGSPSTASSEQLSDVLQRGEQEIQRREQERRQRDLLRQRRGQLQLAVQEAEQRAEESQHALGLWQARWSQAVVEAKLNPKLTARELPAVLQAHDQWRALNKEAAQLRTRIAGIDRDKIGFAEEVNRLRRLVEASADDSAEESVQSMFEGLTVALKQQTLLEQWHSQMEEAVAQRKQYQAEGEVWEQRLRQLCQTAHCQSPDELPAVEALAVSRAQRESDSDQLQRKLQELAEAEGLEAFLLRVEQTAHEDFTWQIDQGSARLQAAEQARTEVAEMIGRLKRELDGMDGSGEAARWQEEIEQEVAAVSSEAQQYIRLRLAVGILERVMDRYRQANQSGVLKRAGDLFADLTQGSFQGLTVESLDNGTFRLLGVRGENAQTIPPNGMSEGTCDQMYLAIRLALLEAYLDRQPPIPLLVDDLFITFDDRRSAAALQVLARLARRTQIIFFTHHQRLVELARTHLSTGDFSVQSLSEQRKP